MGTQLGNKGIQTSNLILNQLQIKLLMKNQSILNRTHMK